MKKLIAILLVMASVLAFAGCPNSGTGDQGGLGVGDKKFIDSLGDRNYGGQEFIVSATDRYSYEAYGKEDSADFLEAEVYKRNTALQDRFNVKIAFDKTIATDLNVHTAYIQGAYNSAQETFDIALLMAFKSGILVTDNMLYDQREYVPYIKDALKLGSDWWGRDVNDAFSVNGHQYVSVSDYCITAINQTYGMAFNSKIDTDDNISKNLGYESMYDIVRKGMWTMDLMRQIVKDRYENNTDVGVIGGIDVKDTFGFMCDAATPLDQFAPALNIKYIINDGINTPELMTMDTRIERAFTSIYDLFFGQGDGVYICDTQNAEGQVATAFAEDRVFLTPMPIYRLAEETMHEMDSDYGIIPYPKAEGMTKYQSGTLDGFSVICILAVHDETRLEFIGTMVEALSAETHNSIIDPYYDLIVTRNSTREEESIEMLNRIMEGRCYDLAILHHQATMASTSMSSNDVCLGTMTRYICNNRISDIVSLWESVQPQFVGQVEDLINTYNSLF